MNLQTGAFGDPASLQTLVLFWTKMEMLHYPGAGETKSYLEEELRRQAQMQQAQMQQAQMQKLQERTQLSAPVALMVGNNQAGVARNGVELANMLIHIQPGATFNLLTKKANVKAVQNDMKANGYIAIGAPTKQGQNTMLVFQKPQQQAAPVSLEQALKML